MNVEQLITHYGYITVLIGAFLEGETIVIIAGFAAHRGYLELPYVMVATFIGAYLGDQFYFYIGHFKGQAFINKRPTWQAKTARVFRLLEKHQTLLILGFRFIYGIRTVTPFILGSSGISPLRFLVLNFCGALSWSIVISSLGYYFGQVLELFIGKIKSYEKWIILALLLMSIIVWFVAKWRDRKRLAATQNNDATG